MTINLSLYIITQLSLILAAIAITINAIYSIVSSRKFNRSISHLIDRTDILMSVPIKKAKKWIKQQEQEIKKEHNDD